VPPDGLVAVTVDVIRYTPVVLTVNPPLSALSPKIGPNGEFICNF
jgi:hypothetical protein